MKISSIAGLIAASNNLKSNPHLKLGKVSVAKHLVQTYRQCGIFPIVVMISPEDQEIRYELNGQGVIFLEVKDKNQELFQTICEGIEYLQNKCDRVVFAPVNIPFVQPETIDKLMKYHVPIVSPSYQGKAGHPIVLAQSLFPKLLGYKGEQGLRGAISFYLVNRKFVDVDDPMVLASAQDSLFFDEAEKKKLHSYYPFNNLELVSDSMFFDHRLKLLLFLIDDTNNVKKACAQMGLSYGKAWTMLNRLEEELGIQIIDRHQGGSHGGKTKLTNEGIQFLKRYHTFEKAVYFATRDNFKSIFPTIK